MAFAQLRVLSGATMFATPIQINTLAAAAKARGYQALALTDVNVVANLVPFYTAMRAAGLKPLLGMQVRVADDDFILMALSAAGYQQLLRISTYLQLTENPTFDQLPDFTGLACITTEHGLVAAAYAAGDGNLAASHAQKLLAKQPDRFAIGMPLANLQAEFLRFAEVHQWPAVPLGDVRELDAQDAMTIRLLQAIKAGKKFREMTGDRADYLLADAHLVADRIQAAGMPQLLTNCQDLIDAATVTLEFGETQLPSFPIPDDAAPDAATYLRQLSTTGLRQIQGGVIASDYQQRLDRELGVIHDMGFDDYFLIVQDIVHAAQARGIMTGPGRGSAAGSLVAYALGITTVDPLQFNLLFERFLNPNRHQMPDIDLDVEDSRRGEVLQYMYDKYGREHCSQIMAFGTFGARQAIRDAAGALELPSYKLDELIHLIPRNADKVSDIMADKRVSVLMGKEKLTASVLRAAQRLEGIQRTISTHAAGVVLSAGPLTNVVALETSSVGIGVQTQMVKEGVEKVGLLKIDVLGLRTLGILRMMQTAYERIQGQPIDLRTIDLNDPKTLGIFAAGDTTGVFQFESRPMRGVLRKVQPQSFEDVVAVAALYRPGPMQYIDEFAARRHGQRKVEYVSPLLEPILAPTYGIIVYQEQVMQVASSIGGLTLAEADDLRRAMSKKKQAVIDAAKPKFMAGAAQRGVSETDAAQIFDDIERFAGYGFNRSHAAAYGKLAVQMAYFKAHVPAAFYLAQLNANLGASAKIGAFAGEMRQKGVRLLRPDIDRSSRGFVLDGANIRMGLGNLKGLRRDLIDAIIAERKENGHFAGVQDFLLRLDDKWLTETALRPLVAAGALDGREYGRAEMLAQLQGMCAAAQLAGGSRDLLGAVWPKMDAGDLTHGDVLSAEAEVIGFYLNGNPADEYAELLQARGGVPLAQAGGQRTVTVIVLAESVRVISTKAGNRMAFMTVSDQSGQAEVTIFPEAYLQARGLKQGAVYLMRVRGDKEQGGPVPKLLAQSVTAAEPLLAASERKLFLNLGSNPSAEMKKQVWGILAAHHGDSQVIVVIGSERLLLEPRYSVLINADLMAQLGELLPPEALAISPNPDSSQTP
ncbi:DNA polymerase III subunit alpha [Lacticaseibacillus pabuli]|uniref:DNA-directed DNA polymerase n=1 Tax=Lacticaseibacillus pabuli TaxID=3025672 RepID=A0ABY7WRL0_9LACO|nr:DNA polymerase III subunit alpha [Lacticaseibacillus sp. KACC 23028]WDF81606.1 DNA polymerase III subunit alpha [Lacticaseibacillus sp. KACC 23028]